MENPIKKYYTSVWSRKCSSDKLKDVITGHLFLIIPHIIASVIIIAFFPEKWIGILILGIFLSDLSLGINNFLKFGFPKLFEKFREYMSNTEISLINHVMLISVMVILLLLEEYVLFLSGLIHLILDIIGF